MLKIGKNIIWYHYHGETVRIEPWGESAFRVRAWMTDTEPRAYSALLEPEEAAVRTEREASGAFAHNGGLTVRVTENGVIGFYNQKRELLLEEYHCGFQAGRDTAWPTRAQRSPLKLAGREWKGTPRGFGITARFTAPPQERLYGMGQYQQECWNLKGAVLELMQRNSQCSVPFVLSSAGYGFLWNNPAVGQAVFGTNITQWEAPACDLMDYWVTAADTPGEILGQYAQATGHAPNMPEWGLGFWQCKLRYRTQEEVLRVAEEYVRRGIPLDVIIIDFFHWTCLGEWEFDHDAFPEPKAMIDKLHQWGVRAAVSIWPQVAWKSRYHKALYERGLLVRADRGCDLMEDYGGSSTHLDMTHPEARRFIWEKVKENYESCGVDFYWLDEAEPEYAFYHQENYRYHLGPAMRVGNLYPACYAKAFFEPMRQAPEGRTVNLIRCAWAGSQRYGALVWSGDVPSTFRAMKMQVLAGQQMGLAGIPWWTHDIGGFRGGDIHDTNFQELLMRWFAFGAFSPVMRLHGHREPVAPEEAAKGHLQTGAENEIWSFGEEAYAVCRKYIRIRQWLRPYLRRAYREAQERGLPVMRALLVEFPRDEQAWNAGESYLLGGDLLCAPVTEPGAEQKSVYLPRGDAWRDVWSGTWYTGGQTVAVPAPRAQIPVFLRGRKADALWQELCMDAWREA